MAASLQSRQDRRSADHDRRRQRRMPRAGPAAVRCWHLFACEPTSMCNGPAGRPVADMHRSGVVAVQSVVRPD